MDNVVVSGRLRLSEEAPSSTTHVIARVGSEPKSLGLWLGVENVTESSTC